MVLMVLCSLFVSDIDLAWHITAITSLKAQVEGLQDPDQSVEILVRLVCAVPGWNDKNVQVADAL